MTPRSRARRCAALGVLLLSEVTGCAMFQAAERATSGPDRELWGALAALEAQTRAAIEPVVGELADRHRQALTRFSDSAAATGSLMSQLPRGVQLHAVVTGTKGFMPAFRLLDREFHATPEASLFAYVIEHELAIADVGRRALAGDGGAIAPVTLLLGATPGAAG